MISLMIYMESKRKKKTQMNLFPNRKRLTDTENKLWLPKGKRGWEKG